MLYVIFIVVFSFFGSIHLIYACYSINVFVHEYIFCEAAKMVWCCFDEGNCAWQRTCVPDNGWIYHHNASKHIANAHTSTRTSHNAHTEILAASYAHLLNISVFKFSPSVKGAHTAHTHTRIHEHTYKWFAELGSPSPVHANAKCENAKFMTPTSIQTSSSVQHLYETWEVNMITLHQIKIPQKRIRSYKRWLHTAQHSVYNI